MEGGIAGVATVGAAGIEIAQEAVAETQDTVLASALPRDLTEGLSAKPMKEVE